MEGFTGRQIVLMASMLITGAITTLSKKAQFDCVAKGYNGEIHSFNHPWFQTWMLFIAQTLCLIAVPIFRRREMKHYKSQAVQTEQTDEPLNSRQFMLGIGLLYVDASIMLMLKGSVVISTGLFSHLFLKRKLKLANWIGIAVVIVGLVLAGCSSVFKNQDHKTIAGRTTTGIILVLGAQVVSGGQFTLEEVLLKSRNLNPLHYVGIKGIYGFVLLTFVILPAMYFIPGSNANGSFENSIDALIQISNSTQLLLLCLLYLVAVAAYNCTAMAVMRSLSAVHSTLIDACRTIMVWVVGITIYYGFDKNFGEPFDKTYGILQIDGFFFLVIGTSIYKHILELKNFVPCWKIFIENKGAVNKDDRGSQENDNDTRDENKPLLTENKA